MTVTARVGPVAIPYLMKGTTVGRSELGSCVAMSLYRWVRGVIGEAVSSDEARTVILAEEGLTVGGEVLVPAGPTAAPILQGTAGEVRTIALPNGATMDFVWIPAGTFTIGSPASEPGRHTDEDPPRQVTITQGFCLGKCEVTQGQWQAVMQSTPWARARRVAVAAHRPIAATASARGS